MIYELTKSIAEGSVNNYLRADWNETKEDFRSITEATCTGAKWTARNAGSILAKASYPVAGNLCIGLRERLEECLGKDVFDSRDSGAVSGIANGVVFGGLLAYYGPDVLDGLLGGYVLGLMHAGVRCAGGNVEKRCLQVYLEELLLFLSELD